MRLRGEVKGRPAAPGVPYPGQRPALGLMALEEPGQENRVLGYGVVDT